MEDGGRESFVFPGKKPGRDARIVEFGGEEGRESERGCRTGWSAGSTRRAEERRVGLARGPGKKSVRRRKGTGGMD